MAKQISINGYKYYAIYLAIAQTPSGRLPFDKITAATKTISKESFDIRTLKADLAGMFRNAATQNDRLKLYVKGSNVANTRALRAAFLHQDANGKYQVKGLNSTLWNDSVWSIMPFEDEPTTNRIAGSVLTHGIRHRTRGIKPFKSYRAKLDQQMSAQRKQLSKTSTRAKDLLDDSSEKARKQLDKRIPQVKEQTDNFYRRVRGASLRFRNLFRK